MPLHFHHFCRHIALLLLALITIGGCSIFKNTSSNSHKPEMVYIEGGTFRMGDIYEGDNPDAMPVHSVSLPDFRIGKYEVTYREYKAYARRRGRPLPEADSLGRGRRPVTGISWKQAQEFCEYYGWRLPTEQEWEYAARSGGKKQKFAGTNNIDSLKIYARTENNSAPFAFPVGSKKPNDIGLYDMSGNVLEWIGRYYQFYPENGKEPKWDNLDKRSVRIIRGGSFREGDHIASTYWRVGILKEDGAEDVGFRCVDSLHK